jgi:hypothetical protein
MTAWNWTSRSPSHGKQAEPMTARARGGQAAASPSRLARSAPPLRGCGLDCLSPARRGLAMRSRLEVSGTAPLATDEPKRLSRMLWHRHRSFCPGGVCAILPACPGTALLCATAPHSANYRPIFISCPVPGRAVAGPSSTTLRRGGWSTTGSRACRSPTPRSPYSRHGSVIFSTNYLGHAYDVRRRLP